MRFPVIVFVAAITVVILLDQYVKTLFIEGLRYDSQCITLSLVYNKGVAFSMFASLGHYLKYIQIALLLMIFAYTVSNKTRFLDYYLGIGFVLGGGISNIIDRFFHIGVVDYVYWHCGFDFAIFNLADVMIDVGIGILLIKLLFFSKKPTKPQI